MLFALFTFNTYLFFTVCFLILLLLLHIAWGNMIWSKRTLTYIISIAFSFWGVMMVDNYTHPSENVFTNLDHHVLEHLGYQYQKEINLVDEKNRSKSLWDSKQGFLKLTSNLSEHSIEGTNFYEPFYTYNFNSEEYHLENAIYDQVPIDDYLEIRMPVTIDSLRTEERTIFSLRIKEGRRKNKAVYEVSFGDGKVYSHEFSRLQEGYSLFRLATAADFSRTKANEEVLAMLEGTLLIRTRVPSSKKRANYSSLTLFPSPLLAETKGLVISNGESKQKVAKHTFKTAVDEGGIFYVGFPAADENRLRILKGEGGNYHLRHLFPKRYELKDEEENNLFLCSSFEDVSQNVSSGGYYFPLMKEEKNVHHISGNIIYYKGAANEQLLFKVMDQKVGLRDRLYQANQPFTLSTDTNTLDWEFQVHNFLTDHPIKAAYLVWFILGFWLLFLILSILSARSMTTAEAILYVVVFSFLLIRIILQWRMAAFPPIEDIKMAEFNFLRSQQHFLFTCLFTAFFWLVRYLLASRRWMEDFWEEMRAKVRYRLGIKQDRTKQTGLIRLLDKWLILPFTNRTFWQFALIYMCLHVIGFLIGMFGISERFANIAMPVFIYFFTAYVNARRDWDYEHDTYNINPFRALNTFVTLGIIAALDTGYSIIFLLFILLFELFRNLQRLYQKRGARKRKRALATVIVVGLGFVLIILFGIPLFRFVLQNGVVTYLVAFALVLVLGLYFANVMTLRHENEFLHRRRTYWLGGVAALILVICIGSFNRGTEFLEKYSYAKYRAEIFGAPLNDILTEKEFQSTEVDLVLRAAQNQWFINTYLEGNFSEEEKQKKTYFNLKPHFNKGASYITQTTDLAITRYLVSEHSIWAVRGLLVLMIMLCIGFSLSYRFTFDPNDSKSKNFISFGVLLLLFTMAFFIWLTCTNRFIFFGQDFPFISLTSKLTLAFCFVLLLLAYFQAEGERRVVRFNYFSLIPFVLIFLIGVFIKQPYVFEEDDFQLNETMEAVKSECQTLNTPFKKLQEDYKRQHKINELSDEDLPGLIKALTTDPNLSTDGLPTVFESEFSKSIFRYFLKNDASRWRNMEEMLHLINVRGRYQFSLNKSYYLVQPPREYRSRWGGNILAANTQQKATLANLKRGGKGVTMTSAGIIKNILSDSKEVPPNLRITQIPAEWTKEKELLLIASTYKSSSDKTGTMSVENTAATRYAPYRQAFEDISIRVLPNDKLSFFNKRGKQQAQYMYSEEPAQYLMKNIWLNGRQRFFYPLEERFLWAYHYANAANNAMSKDTTGTKFYEDVQLSIDSELSSNIYNLIAVKAKAENWKKPVKKGRDRYRQYAVSAMDGEGRLRLMVDYKPQIELNPNDVGEINDYNRNFYLNRVAGDEREVYGNRNLLIMQPGPGSSIKPIMYSAVTSQVPTTVVNWKALRSKEPVYRKTNQGKMELVMPNPITAYGGRSMGGYQWQMGRTDLAPMDNVNYLIRSSNIYHSLIMFLGSYDIASLKNHLTKGKSILTGGVAPEIYPRIGYLSDRTLTFNKDFWPPGENQSAGVYFSNTKSVLANGLENNYQLDTWDRKNGIQYQNFDGETPIFNRCNPYLRNYSFPEKSHFYQAAREAGDGGSFTAAISQSTVGGSPIEVSPVKMLEMYGKMISMNSKLKVHLNEKSNVNRYESFDTKEWGSQAEYASFTKQNIFLSLDKVISSSGTETYGQGTANKYMRGIVSRRNKSRKTKLHYYAKTGTIANKEEATKRNIQKINDRLLAVVISKNDLTQLSPQQLATNPFYVLYLYDHLGDNPDVELIEKVLIEVEESLLFKEYMRIK